MLNHSLSRTPELCLSTEQHGSQLQLNWILLYPWQQEAEPEESHTEPFWVFSQYLAKLSGVSLQRESTTEKLQIKVYLVQAADLTAAY